VNPSIAALLDGNRESESERSVVDRMDRADRIDIDRESGSTREPDGATGKAGEWFPVKGEGIIGAGADRGSRGADRRGESLDCCLPGSDRGTGRGEALWTGWTGWT